MAVKAPKRMYYSIGQAAEMVGVRPSVLRFWETEFPFLRPKKNRAGNRVYQPSDLKKVVLVRRLLHEEGFTIAGAKRRIAQAADTEQIEMWCEAATERDVLDSVRADVRELLAVLESGDPADGHRRAS